MEIDSSRLTLHNGVQLSNSTDGNRLKIQGRYGNLTIGPANSEWCHFNTDRAKFWFEKNVHVNGEIYAGSGYNQRVFHQGWTPRSGNWWSGGAAFVNTDGVMEIGKYIDFHDSNSTTADYNARLTCTGSELAASGTFKANGNIGTNGSIYAGSARVAVQAGHGGLDLGNTDRQTAICSGGQPTWWNGSTSHQLVYSVKDSGGYPMIMSDNHGWIRTPPSGLLPNTSGTGSGRANLGTTGWRFSDVWSNQINATSLYNTTNSSGTFCWNNSNSDKYRFTTHTSNGGTAAPNLTTDQPTIKMYNGGGGLHLFPARDAAGGMVVARGNGWGNYGDVTCSKVYAVSDARKKKNIAPLDTPGNEIAQLCLSNEETTGSVALDIIKNAKAYSYMHIYDDDS